MSDGHSKGWKDSEELNRSIGPGGGECHGGERGPSGLTLKGNGDCKEENIRIWNRQWGRFVSEQLAVVCLYVE